jgi:ABC-type uncharacterized transport system permease subunit
MNKAVAMAFLVGGIVLLVYGYHAAQSMNSAFSRIFTGSPSNKTIWMVTCGVIATITGIIGLSSSSK